MIDFEKIYGDFIKHKNEQNRVERYKNNEHWYGASSSGSCRRKLYFKNVEKVKPTNEPQSESLRKMRFGTIWHDDMEKALKFYNDNNNDIKFHYEEELTVPEYNVRGFFDCVAEFPNGEIHLIDFKTIGSYPWKLKFGRNGKPHDDRYSMQLGMYAQGVIEKYGRVDKMYLLYKNKDT